MEVRHESHLRRGLHRKPRVDVACVIQPRIRSGAGWAEARLKSLNITLPADAAPAANFVNSVQSGKLLFLSGNTAGAAWVGKGKLGKDLTVEQGREAARQAGLIMLTKIRTALGSLDRVKRVVKVLGMVNSAEGFGDQPCHHDMLNELAVVLSRVRLRPEQLPRFRSTRANFGRS